MRTHTTLAAAALFLLGVHGAATDEAGQAAITDPTAECTDYNYPPVAAAAASFPTLWQPVASVPTTDPGYAKFTAMNASIPNIAPKGVNGVPSGVIDTYSQSADPDCWWSASQCTTPKVSGLKPDMADMPEPRTLGYGFDDGPNCSHNAFYDYLTAKNQKATMYYIGSSVMIWPLQAQRAVSDGHEICVHTWSHRSMTAFTNEQAFGELWFTMQAIKLVTGVTPTCWRPPLGDVDDRIRYIATQLGLVTVMWKYDAFDWQVGAGTTPPVTAADVQANYDKLISAANNGTFNTVGAIMLTHELNNFTMQTAIDNYPKLIAAFDHLTPVGVGYNRTNPYVEQNYTQPSFSAYVAARSGGGSSASGSAGGASQSGAAASGAKTGASAQASGSSDGVVLRVSGVTLVLALAGVVMAAL
ncbi:carbohydrate esterase family 4 protein [Mycena vitilis]|nr:carbohydrate esterase family 4 protein [Mycena vitilis]